MRSICIKNLTVLAVIIMLLFVTSCKDDNTYFSYDQEVVATNDYVIGQQMMILILNTYFKSISDSLLLATGKSQIDGASIYYNGSEFDTLIIHYPIWGNDDGYDHWRAGDIRVSTNQGFLNIEEPSLVSFIDFRYDKDTLRTKDLYIQYMGEYDSQSDLFHIYSDSISLIYSDTSGVSVYNMQQAILRFKDSSGDYYAPDDRFEISNLFSGVSKEGVIYQTETSLEQPLINQFDCAFLKKGPVSISFEGITYSGAVYFSELDTCVNQYVAELDGNPFPNVINTHD